MATNDARLVGIPDGRFFIERFSQLRSGKIGIIRNEEMMVARSFLRTANGDVSGRTDTGARVVR
jgi:hypothetical protein